MKNILLIQVEIKSENKTDWENNSLQFLKLKVDVIHKIMNLYYNFLRIIIRMYECAAQADIHYLFKVF